LYIACIGCNNCLIHGRVAEAKQWLADGQADFRTAGVGACRSHPNALAGRSIYLFLRDGSLKALDGENRDAGRRGPQTEACYDYMASLYRARNTDQALTYLRQFTDQASEDLAFQRAAFMVDQDLNAARAECRRALAAAGRTRGWWYLIPAFSLVGLPNEARRIGANVRPTPDMPEWDLYVPFELRLLGHIYGNQPLDLDLEIAGSRSKRWLAYDALGYAALVKRDRAGARRWFRKAAEHPPLMFVTGQWQRALYTRLLADKPVWPPWLATEH
jgi:hypothetical protein